MTASVQSSEPGPAVRFVTALGQLTPSELKTLRRATGSRRGQDVHVYDIFCRLFRPLRRKFVMARWAYYLVATLYPWHPETRGTGNLGDALKRFRPPARDKENRDRSDRRFTRLLDAKGRDLGAQLLACLRQLRDKDAALDWTQLLEDLSQWYDAGQPIQNAWARSYFN